MLEDTEPYIVWDEDVCKLKIRDIVDVCNCHCVSLLLLLILTPIFDNVVDG